MDSRSELPVGVAAFIGRDRERATVADLLSRARVVTLTGSGGSRQDPAGRGGRRQT